ncbi:SDR family NAD(P)-dependent oxidoreductase [Leifsonia sp. AG29]|uniref:SDR family NAD(P)-dependent oxidoreductase n=1 Tax=Leifsonia sp. AG29 TaxID=2598860 RepID=UPI00131D398A|nr:SDR family oxidoreductase [Leifsonia sp. AG29]
MGRFTDKVILITGGNSGMGKAVARRIAAEGGAVVVGARRQRQGEETVADIRSAGGTALFVPTDVTVESQVASLVETAVREFGRLDGAFNNAGGGRVFGPVQNIDADDWASDVAVNLTSVFYALKYEIPAVQASGGGSLLNNASNLGVVGMPTASPYVAAKHGVVGLTRSAALELAQSGVRVNAMVSGGVDTPLFRSSMGATAEGAAYIASLHPVNRVATPEEIAGFAAYLLSDETTFITGAALAIDGGWTAQ